MSTYFNGKAIVTAFFSTRKGLEIFLVKELEELNSFKLEYTPNLLDSNSTFAYFRSKKDKESNLIKTNILSGGVEVHCTWAFLGIALFYTRSSESIWLRVGRPFRCYSIENLHDRIKTLPWNYFLPTDWMSKINIRSMSTFSSLWNNYMIKKTVKDSFLTSTDIITANGHCLSIVLHRNTCYISLQFSGNLSPRHYSFFNYRNQTRLENEIPPHWSLREIGKDIQCKITGIPYLYNYNYILPMLNTINKIPPNGNLDITKGKMSKWELNRKKFIESAKISSDDSSDYNDTFISCITHNINLDYLLKSPEHLIIWVPYCGSGRLIFEIIGYILKLPTINNSLYGLPLPDFKCFNNEWFDDSWNQFISYREQKSKSIKTKQITLIGTDSSNSLLEHINNKVMDFYNYYHMFFKGDPKVDKDNSICSYHSTLESDLNISINISFHKTKFEQLASFIKGALVIIKIPQQQFNKYHKMNKIISLQYEKIGNLISSRYDWKGVYALSRGRLFDHFSRLEWVTLFESSNSKGNIIRFQRWTGRKKSLFKFTTQVERNSSLYNINTSEL